LIGYGLIIWGLQVTGLEHFGVKLKDAAQVCHHLIAAAMCDQRVCSVF